jgi:hypothetical protein
MPSQKTSKADYLDVHASKKGEVTNKNSFNMKKQIRGSLFLIALALTSQIPIGMAYQFSYDWSISDGVGGSNEYELSLMTAESWQVDTTFNIVFRLTLVSKSSVLDHTETSWVKVVLSSESFILDSGNQTEIVALTNVGDYWEKKVAFHVPAEKLNRGETLKVYIFFLASINEINGVQKLSRQYDANNYYNPMPVNLMRPIISRLELIVTVMIVVVILVFVIGGFMLHRKGKGGIKPRPPTKSGTQTK